LRRARARDLDSKEAALAPGTGTEPAYRDAVMERRGSEVVE
jgi:hypothetical protein